ncbi:MAG: hypothetical protein NZM05_09255 [Chloroherpetonaceae bacterium]|nr:hypothetical protein [Chloroherpetonaceae bacterium]MCS7212581.1 hypothetical protein [Chloroherpetonaceae bacterium]
MLEMKTAWLSFHTRWFALALVLLSALLYFGCSTPESVLKSIDTANEDQQLAEFERFAREHPNLPESVYALFRRGTIFQRRGQFMEAKTEYRRALERNQALAQKNPRYTLLALYNLTDLQYLDYKAMQPSFVIPPSAFEPKQSAERITYTPETNEKLQLKQTLAKQMTHILNEFRHQGASIEEYMTVALAVCRLSEEFGDGFSRLSDSVQTLRNAQGRALHPNKRILAAYQANVDAAAQYAIAASDYKTLRGQLLDARSDSTVSPDVHEYITPTIDKLAEQVVEMRYKQGYAHEKNALLALSAMPDESQRMTTVKLPIEQLDLNIGEIASLMYLFQVVERFVRPSIEQAVKAYKQGLKEAAEMNVATTNYAAMSEQGLLELSQRAALRVDSLAMASFATFDTLRQLYQAHLTSLSLATPADTLALFLQFKKMERLVKTCRTMLVSTLLEHEKAYGALREVGFADAALAPVKERAQLSSAALRQALHARRELLARSISAFQQTAKKEKRKVWFRAASQHYQSLLDEWQGALNDFQESCSRLAVMR